MNPDRYLLTPGNCDGVTSALIGNGELCTTVGPSGYHTPPEQQTDIAHRTQHFVMAGRRRQGPRHALVNLGTISRRLRVDGSESDPETWEQELWADEPRSWITHRVVDERTSSYIALQDNVFVATTSLANHGLEAHEIEFELTFTFGEREAITNVRFYEGGADLDYRVGDLLGTVRIRTFAIAEESVRHYSTTVEESPNGLRIRHRATLQPAESLLEVRTYAQFSDRSHFTFPLEPEDIGDVWQRHIACWERFWSAGWLQTDDRAVDRFWQMSRYTLRCQSTPWSVPPTVSEEYWGAGTFHDEMYPFLGLLSSNHVELAERIPYFRLTTLPQAIQRARARGALYPWSSTEDGQERDPNGLWLTERFHLGQFAVCIWMLWLYNRDRIQLDDLYPVLREIARYFEMNMLERDDDGRLRTKACVDFDESVGEVTNGPFTICAAISSLEYAANAAEELNKDPERIPCWRKLAAELGQNIPSALTTAGAEVFGIPGGKPLHYSILGPIFPFLIEVDSERARASADHIHRVCRSTKGWRPGFSDVFEGSNWMWMAGHLGVVHALQGNAELAWEAIKTAPESAGPFLSPNEHVDREGVIHVPWFTTGCGGWLYALNCLFVQVDEKGTKLLPAVPESAPNARFSELRGDRGVLVSAEFRDARLISLSARGPKAMGWRFRIPTKYREQVRFKGSVEELESGWLLVDIPNLGTETESLLMT